MGWWGEGVFDGDTPCDCIYVCFEAVGRDYEEYFDCHELTDLDLGGLTRNQFSRMANKAFGFASSCGDDALTTSACATVLAEFALQNNVLLPNALRNEIRRPIQFEVDNIDRMGWCEPQSRLRVLRALLRRFDRRYSSATNGTAATTRRPRRASHTRDGGMSRTALSRSRGWRRFECINRTSAKFWEITKITGGWRVRFGRIGTEGRTTEKTGTQNQFNALIYSKLSKGYREV